MVSVIVGASFETEFLKVLKVLYKVEKSQLN